MEVAQLLGGRYALTNQLGHGGMAVVWRARDEVLRRTVAVKLLAGVHAGDPRARQRIRAEAQFAALLSHPHIAQVYDYGESVIDGALTPYVVMELVRGGTLQDRLLAGPMTPRFAMRVAAEIAAALAAAHSDGMVHRDIKPANVMLTESGVKVVDFGIAAAIGPSEDDADDHEILGTPAYLAPERLTDDAVQPAADVYALGVVLYRMLSGRSPWTVETTTQLLAAHVYVDPEPLPLLPGVPDYVVALCNRCLSKSPAERPSAREAGILLESAAGVRTATDDRPAAPAPPAAAPAEDEPDDPPAVVPAPVPVPRRRRRRLVLAVIAAFAAAAAGWLLIPDPTDAPGSVAGPSGPAAIASAPAPPAGSPVPSAGAGSGRPSGGSGGAVPPAADGDGRTDVADLGADPIRPRVRPTGAAATTGTRPADDGSPATDPADEPDEPDYPSEPDEPDEPVEATLTSSGGSVRATCPSAGTAKLLSWSPSGKFKVDDVDPGPAAAPSATFKHGNDRVRLTVTCAGGVPRGSSRQI